MICALILAAGRSRRMGTQKLLLPLGGKPVITHVVDTLLRSGVVAQVFVVVGPDGELIRQFLAGRTVQFVGAGETKDMLGTVRAGLRALPKRCDSIFVALGDQPELKTPLLKRMVAAQQDSGRGIIVPSYRGQCGHPLLFSSRFRKEILTRYDDTGLRGLRHAHPEEVLMLKTTSASVLEDLDTPEDYQLHLKRFG